MVLVLTLGPLGVLVLVLTSGLSGGIGIGLAKLVLSVSANPTKDLGIRSKAFSIYFGIDPKN